MQSGPSSPSVCRHGSNAAGAVELGSDLRSGKTWRRRSSGIWPEGHRGPGVSAEPSRRLAVRCTTPPWPFMKHSIHDLDDQRATKILSNCHRAVKPNGKVVVVDREIRAPNAPDPKKFFDVAMMLMPRGRERSEPEEHLFHRLRSPRHTHHSDARSAFGHRVQDCLRQLSQPDFG